METSIYIERKKKGMDIVHNSKSHDKRMDEIEEETKKAIDKELDKKHENSTDWVLDHTDKIVELDLKKKSSQTIDTFKGRCRRLLLGMFQRENTD